MQQIQNINLDELRNGFGGKPFYKLIQHHLKSQNQQDRIFGLLGTMDMLPADVRPLVEGFIDRWNSKCYDRSFWQQDTAIVFDDIINDAQTILSRSGLQSDDELKFNLFTIVTLNYAYAAYDQPKMRAYMGMSRCAFINGAFPFFSLIALIYPIGATIHISNYAPATIPMIIGYGLTNLGYLLLVAGIVSGKFGIFGLTKRWQVLSLSLTSILIGISLSNL
ncbi:MAG: hypothetical protein A2018_00045 [Alphaproteobacteria bacterium GWF2_58_20]|nr:MAG: hypothetical protein A2018_00045 [Alphaproteobacteria bacterium GWF2_58_20]